MFQTKGRGYAWALAAAIPAGVASAFIHGIAHYQTPFFTVFAVLSLFLALLGVIDSAVNRGQEDNWQLILGSFCFLGFVTLSLVFEPFLHAPQIDGLLEDSFLNWLLVGTLYGFVWIAPVGVAGIWFARHERWILAVAAWITVWISISALIAHLFDGHVSFFWTLHIRH